MSDLLPLLHHYFFILPGNLAGNSFTSHWTKKSVRPMLHHTRLLVQCSHYIPMESQSFSQTRYFDKLVLGFWWNKRILGQYPGKSWSYNNHQSWCGRGQDDFEQGQCDSWSWRPREGVASSSCSVFTKDSLRNLCFTTYTRFCSRIKYIDVIIWKIFILLI